ncbi:MAG: succinate dehydrogenase, cytochrome b556 subunit [Hyphomicrobiaceae bacterium]
MMRPHNAAYRRDALWRIAMIHRLSGVALACFLPLHFLALGLSLNGEGSFDQFLRWTDQPIVKVAETVLVGLLAVHVLGGVRLLLIENMPWRPGQKQMALGALAVAVVVAAVFLLGVV